MASSIIKKITKLSELPELNKPYGKTIVAFERENYQIDLSLIRGKKITNIKDIQSTIPGEPNLMLIEFSDGTSARISAYNGSEGDKGRPGYDGIAGPAGDTNTLDLAKVPGAIAKYTIVNDNNILALNVDKYGNVIDENGEIVDVIDDHDESCTNAWSAYRGKVANESIEKLNETFLTEAQYDTLFTNGYISWIEAKFTTTEDNQETKIFNDDTNSHIKYQKFWTFEETDTGTYYVYNEHSGTYDPVVADLWDDIYFGDKSGMFPVTDNQFNDGTVLWWYDEKDGEYKQVTEAPFNMKDIIGEDGNPTGETEFATKSSFTFLYYDKDIDTYIDIAYDYLTSRWSYKLHAASEIRPVVYTIDGTIVNNSTIDVNGYVVYYTLTEDGTLEPIENLASYLADKKERWYAINDESEYEEVASEADVDTANHQAYIKVTVDSINGTTTFHKWNPYVKYRKTYYEEIEKTYGSSGIQLYTEWEDRTYYTIDYVMTTDDNGETTVEAVYTEVQMPTWVFAKFLTTYEDERTLLLNSAGVPAGQEVPEDNYEEDTTAEFYGEDQGGESIPVEFMVAGDVTRMYLKDAESGLYLEVPINYALSHNMIYYANGELVINEQYVYDTGEFEYIEVGEDDPIDLQNIYYKKDGDSYVPANVNEDDNETYYLKGIKYAAVTPETFSEHEITLIAGVPQQLQISFYPENATNKKALIEFDDTKITFYEGGRIASLEELDEDDGYKETDIYITPETGQGLHIHVKVVKPVDSIDLYSEGYGFIGAKTYNGMPSLALGDNVELRALVKPKKASDKTLVYTGAETLVSIGEQTRTGNEVSVAVSGVKQGMANLLVKAADGYGASALTQIDVVKPVESSTLVVKANPGPNDMANMPDEHFASPTEVNDYNVEHGYSRDDEGYIMWDAVNPPIKTPAHLEMTILKSTPENPLRYEIPIENMPSESSKVDFNWTVTPGYASISKGTKLVEVEKARVATAEDVDNNLAENIGDTIPAVMQEEDCYYIDGSVVGECWVNGVNSFNQEYYAETDNHVTGTALEFKVKVIQSVESITIVSPPVSFNKGMKKQFTAIVEPDTANVKTFEWVSSNESIATVSNARNSFGVVTGVDVGTVTITARALDGSGCKSDCLVTISESLSGIQFNNGMIYVGAGSSAAITAELTGLTSGAANIEWATANSSIATVNGAGATATVNGISTGTTTIIAKDMNNSGVTGTIQVTVIKLVNGIQFAESCTDAIVNVNDIVIMGVDFMPADSTIQVLEWVSSNPSIAKVSDEGIVTALQEGTAEITATTTDGTSLSVSTSITVVK